MNSFTQNNHSKEIAASSRFEDKATRRRKSVSDAESSADIIFKTTFEWIEIYLSKIIESPSPLFRLSGETSMALGTFNLLKHTYKS